MSAVARSELQMHELNQGFSWKPIAGPFRALSEEQARSYNENGYFVLRGALDAKTCAEVAAEIDPIEAMGEAWLRTQPGGRVHIARADEITFTTHLVKRSERLRSFVASSPWREVAQDILGPDVRLYWDQAVYKKPGTPTPFPWHQDNGYAFIEPQQYLTCWIALTRADEDSGCPWIVPGAHVHGTLAHRWTDLGFICFEDAPRPPVAAPVEAGDAVVFSSLTPHTTGPHRGTHVRKAYIVQYAPDGADVLRPDGRGGANRVPANDPERQFPVVVGGVPVPA
jgi:ectoine hydroxylase-related dioxygenase (phytanoyl-CoA dioxygenase family)